MQLVLALTLLASLVTSAFASQQLGCAEAYRFGSLDIVPSTLEPGDPFTITATFNCTAYFGIQPVSIDYLLVVLGTSNNGHEPDILLARHAYPTAPSGQFPVDQFNVTLPTYPGYFKGAPYQVELVVTYPVDNGDGTSTLIEGGVLEPINLIGGN